MTGARKTSAQTNLGPAILPAVQAQPAVKPKARPVPGLDENYASLSLIDRRALLYLYFRLEKFRMARLVAQDILRAEPGDRQTLLLLISLYQERGETGLALQTAQRLVKFHPNDAEARLTLARVYQQTGDVAAALELLRQLKAEHESKSGQPFAQEEDLATAALKLGDWNSVRQSYETLQGKSDLDPQMSQQLRNELDQLYRKHLPQATLRETYILPRSGAMLRTTLQYHQPLTARTRVGLRYDRDDIHIDEAQFIRESDNDRYDVLAGWQFDQAPWQFQFWAGASSQGGLFRAGVTRTVGEDARVNLSFASNHRATDSLLIEALDGREDKVMLQWSTPLPFSTYLELQLQARRLYLPSDTLGYGYIGSLNLTRQLLEVLPDVRIGYRALITDFARDSVDPSAANDLAATTARPIDKQLLLENLVEPINLQGIFVTWEHDFNPRWHMRTDAGTDYSFERQDIGYSAEAAVSFFPAKTCELLLEGGYSTSAETSNQESELVQFSLAIRYFF